MGIFNAITRSVQATMVFIIVVMLIAFGITYYFWGNWVLQVMGALFLQTILPSLIMLLGAFLMYFVGIRQEKPAWVLYGFFILMVGLILAIIMGVL